MVGLRLATGFRRFVLTAFVAVTSLSMSTNAWAGPDRGGNGDSKKSSTRTPQPVPSREISRPKPAPSPAPVARSTPAPAPRQGSSPVVRPTLPTRTPAPSVPPVVRRGGQERGQERGQVGRGGEQGRSDQQGPGAPGRDPGRGSVVKPPVRETRPAPQPMPVPAPAPKKPVVRDRGTDNRGNDGRGGGFNRGNETHGGGEQGRNDRGNSGRGLEQGHRSPRDSWTSQHVDASRERMRREMDNRDFREHFDRSCNDFRRDYGHHVVEREVIYRDYYERYRHNYRPYRSYGFCGGFVFGVRPVIDVTIYFGNPLWAAFYTDSVDVVIVNGWCGQACVSHPYTPFSHRRVFYPTVEFRDVVFAVSDFSIDAQYRFREGMEDLTNLVAQRLANASGRSVALAENDLVITNRQILLDRAVVVEGYVDHDGIRFGFKALIDLRNSRDNMFFFPGTVDGVPSQFEIDTLERMNTRILDLGGTVNRNFED